MSLARLVVTTPFSAFVHVAIFGAFVIAAHRKPADMGTREPVAPVAYVDVDTARPSEAKPAGPGPAAPRATAARAKHDATSLPRPGGDLPMHPIGNTPIHEGEWVGTYDCLGSVYGLAIRIEHVRGDEFRVVGNATSPAGQHGTYAQHGVRDASGQATFLPDGWIGPPIPEHHVAGMHGRFDGDTFDGRVDDPACTTVHLERHVG